MGLIMQKQPSRVLRRAVLAATAVAAVAGGALVAQTPASAAVVIWNGSWSTQAQCEEARVEYADATDYITFPCVYKTSPTAGWYFKAYMLQF